MSSSVAFLKAIVIDTVWHMVTMRLTPILSVLVASWNIVSLEHKLDRVPTRTGKPGKMGRYFPVREKSGNFEQTGKVRENHTKYWKTEINWDKYYLIFLVIFKWTLHYLLKWINFSVKKNKTFKKYWKNGKKYWKSQGILSVRKSGNPARDSTIIPKEEIA